MSKALFATLQLPVKPALAADAAQLHVLEEPNVTSVAPFFGGYAEDFLADLGLDQAAEAPRQARVKQV